MDNREMVVIRDLYYVSVEGFLLSEEYEFYIEKQKMFYIIEEKDSSSVYVQIIDFKQNREVKNEV